MSTERIPDLDDGVVRLRPWTPSDAELRVEAGHDPEVLRFTSVPERPTTVEAEKWIAESRSSSTEGRTASFVLERARDGLAAGSMGLIAIDWTHRRAEVGYWLVHARGEGLARRALELLSRWSFDELGLARLELLTNLDNEPSQAVASRARFHFEGTLRSYGIGRDGRETVHLYSRLPED